MHSVRQLQLFIERAHEALRDQRDAEARGLRARGPFVVRELARLAGHARGRRLYWLDRLYDPETYIAFHWDAPPPARRVGTQALTR